MPPDGIRKTLSAASFENPINTRVELPVTSMLKGQSFGERVMNNFSLLAANRVTHLKVVMLAFACVTLVVGFGLVHSALAQEPASISTV